MADATANRVVDTKQMNAAEGGFYMNFPVAASTHIYKGTYVQGDAGGDITNAGSATVLGGSVWGLAVEEADNSSGSDGDITCKCLVHGTVVDSLTSTKANIGAAVFVDDNQTMTLTAQGMSYLGRIIGIDAANMAIVKMEGPKDRGQTFAVTNYVEDLTLDANTATLGEVADFAATLAAELIEGGVIQGTTAA